jgi:hypothetical protein
MTTKTVKKGQESRATGRPKRVPLAQRNVISLNGIKIPKGMVPRIFNDVDNRINDALAAGYQFVMSDGKLGDERCSEPSKLGSYVTKSVGGGRVGYLMATPEEFYKEDQAAKQAQVDMSEAAMRKPNLKPKQVEDQKGDPAGKVYGEGLTDD